MSSGLATLLLRRRRLVVLALVAVATGFACFVPSLRARFAPEELVGSDEQAIAWARESAAQFGAEPQAVVLVVEADDVLAQGALAWTARAAAELEGRAGVARVDSITTTPLPQLVAPVDDGATLDDLDDVSDDGVLAEAIGAIVAADPTRFPAGVLSLAELGEERVELRLAADERTARAIVRQSALVRGSLVSASGRTMVVVAVLEDAITEDAADALVGATEAWLAASPPPDGVRATLAGLPTMRVRMVSALRGDQTLLVGLASLGSFLVLLLGMRSLPGVMLPLGTVGITVSIAVGGMAAIGEPLNLLTNVIPPLLVTIGLAEAVHMVLRYRDELRVLGDREQAAARTLATMWLPCFVTTFTTALGFGALVLQEADALRRFGVIAAIASMVAYVVTVLFVPAMLPSFDMRGSLASGHAKLALGGLDRAVVALARGTAHRPWTTILLSLALFVGSLALATRVEVDSTLLDQFDDGSDVVSTVRVLEAELGGIRELSVVLEAPDDRFARPDGVADLDAIAAWLSAQEGVLRVTHEGDWLREALALVTRDDAVRAEPMRTAAQMRGLRALLAQGASEARPDPLRRFVSDDGRRARLEVRLADRGASGILAMVDALDGVIRERDGLRATFAGEAFAASRGLERIVRSMGSLSAAVITIFFVMTLLFRSIRLGILSIPPNALPLAMTMAYMALRGIPLNAATVIVFTVTLGLAVDGATHVIARFREELARGGSVEETLLRTVAGSGRAVVLSSVTLLLGYAALLFSAFRPVRLFGELSFVAIAGSLIAQLVLLPALLATFARPRRSAPGSERS